MSENQEFFQKLSVYLKGGQTLVIPFKAAKADSLNPQIETFLKLMGEPEKRDSNFVFQGARVVCLRLADVSAFDVVSFVRKEEEASEVGEKAPKSEGKPHKPEAAKGKA